MNRTFEFQMAATRLFMKIGMRGILIDVAEKLRQSNLAQQQLDVYFERFAPLTILPNFNPNSYPQVTKEVYVERGYEKQWKRDQDGKMRLTTDENALKILIDSHPNDAFLHLMLKWRKLSKLKSTYLDAVIDNDNRIRCSFGWNKTGRNNTSKNPMGTGMNLQNQPRMPLTLDDIIDSLTGEKAIINIKRLFIADPGYMLCEADGMQAEARIVAYWSGDEHYIELFETAQDIHCKNATALMQYTRPGCVITKKDKIERHLGKICSHSTPYGAGPYEIRNVIIKNLGVEYALPIEQIKHFQRAYFKLYPKVRSGYQLKIKKMLERGEPLVNPFGRERKCLGTVDDKTLKEFWAQIPQCCDDKTEVLTAEGWKDFVNINQNDLIANWSLNKAVTYHKPKKIIAAPYTGPMISIQGRNISQVITPNHKVGYFTVNNFITKFAAGIIGQKRLFIPACGTDKNNLSCNNEYLLRLLVAIQADATIRSGTYEWHFTKQRKVERLEMLLIKCLFGYKKYICKDGSIIISIYREAIKANNLLSGSKEFTYELMKLSQSERETVIEELQYWDGQKASKNSISYCTKSEQCANVIQSLAVITGYRSKMRKAVKYDIKHSDIYVVSMVKTRACWGEQTSIISYSGNVYCLETNTGFFIVRRNGKVSITGNSTVPDLINRGIIKWEQTQKDCPTMLQIHDSSMMQIPIALCNEKTYNKIKEVFEIPMKVGERTITIPMELKLGTSWGEMIGNIWRKNDKR